MRVLVMICNDMYWMYVCVSYTRKKHSLPNSAETGNATEGIPHIVGTDRFLHGILYSVLGAKLEPSLPRNVEQRRIGRHNTQEEHGDPERSSCAPPLRLHDGVAFGRSMSHEGTSASPSSPGLTPAAPPP